MKVMCKHCKAFMHTNIITIPEYAGYAVGMCAKHKTQVLANNRNICYDFDRASKSLGGDKHAH